MVAPGFIQTGMTKDMATEKVESIKSKIILKKFGQPEDVAEATLFLVNSNYITGHVLVVDGGLQL